MGSRRKKKKIKQPHTHIVIIVPQDVLYWRKALGYLGHAKLVTPYFSCQLLRQHLHQSPPLLLISQTNCVQASSRHLFEDKSSSHPVATAPVLIKWHSPFQRLKSYVDLFAPLDKEVQWLLRRVLLWHERLLRSPQFVRIIWKFARKRSSFLSPSLVYFISSLRSSVSVSNKLRTTKAPPKEDFYISLIYPKKGHIYARQDLLTSQRTAGNRSRSRSDTFNSIRCAQAMDLSKSSCHTTKPTPGISQGPWLSREWMLSKSIEHL